jgi:uncharacterized membrane protein YozB (DUF420 family)
VLIMKHNLNLVKGVCMVYVNFISTIISVPQKIMGDITFVPPLVVHINSSSTQFLLISIFKEKCKNMSEERHAHAMITE